MRIVERIAGYPAAASYAANSQVDQDLPRVAVLDSIWVRVNGTMTNAAYGTAPTKWNESPMNLIQSIQIIATGALQDTIKSVDFPWLYRQTQMMEGTAPYLSDVGTANTAYNFEANARVFFRNPRSTSTLNTLLDARRLAGLTLRTIWRDQTALVYGGSGGTTSMSNTQLTALLREYYDLPPAAATARFAYLKEQQRLYNIQASQTEYLCPNLPVGNRYRRICFKGTLGTSQYGDNSDTIFANTTSQNIKIRDGSTYPLLSNYSSLRAHNKQIYRVETMPAGYAVWDPVYMGSDAEMYDARYKRQLEALVDVYYTGSNTNNLQLTTVEYVTR